MNGALVATALLAIGGTPQQTGLGIRDSVKNLFTFQRGYQSKIRQASLIPIYNENEFFSYWSRSTGQPAASAPRGVDWVKQMVLAVHLGERSTGGYDVDVMRIDTSNNVASVLVRERKPMPGMMTTQVITSPWVLVRFDRTSLPFKMEMISTNQQANVIMPNGGTVIQQGGTTIIVPNYGPYPGFGDGWIEYDCGVWCASEDTGQFVISTQTEFVSYCVRMQGRQLNEVPMNIDWSTERLVAIHVGARPHPGYRIVVNKVETQGKRGVIYATEVADPTQAGANARASRPYVLVRVKRDAQTWQLNLKKK